MSDEGRPAIGTNQETIERRVLVWPGVTTHERAFGGTEFRLGKRELGHHHDDRELVDISFPRRVRDEAIAAGLAAPHHIFPDTGWVSIWLRDPDDIERAIGLLERSFNLARKQAERRARRDNIAT